MASITRRGKKFCVHYRYTNENGEIKQKWETFADYKTAEARKVEVESQQINNTFIIPKDETLEEFLKNYVTTYGQTRWGLSVYDSNIALIRNYINPLIGHIKIQKITPRMLDNFIHTLKTTPAVSTKTHKAREKYVTDKTIDKICRLLHCAFNQAVKWEIIGRNPMDNVTPPKIEYKKRDIWDVDTIQRALRNC